MLISQLKGKFEIHPAGLLPAAALLDDSKPASLKMNHHYSFIFISHHSSFNFLSATFL